MKYNIFLWYHILWFQRNYGKNRRLSKGLYDIRQSYQYYIPIYKIDKKTNIVIGILNISKLL